jgi:hypothetical protein
LQIHHLVATGSFGECGWTRLRGTRVRGTLGICCGGHGSLKHGGKGLATDGQREQADRQPRDGSSRKVTLFGSAPRFSNHSCIITVLMLFSVLVPTVLPARSEAVAIGVSGLARMARLGRAAVSARLSATIDAAGTTTVRARRALETRNDRAESIKIESTLDTPYRVLIRIGQVAAYIVTNRFIASSRPKLTIAIGMMATDGIGRSSSTVVESAAPAGRHNPMTSPRLTPTTTASAKPCVQTRIVVPPCTASSPLTFIRCQARRIALGGGR